MTNEDIANLLKTTLSLTDVRVKSEGTHFQIIAIDDKFEEMSRVKSSNLFMRRCLT